MFTIGRNAPWVVALNMATLYTVSGESKAELTGAQLRHLVEELRHL